MLPVVVSNKPKLFLLDEKPRREAEERAAR